MRLWSISPTYLDRQGLLAVWREALLGQSVLLKGEYTPCTHCEGCLGYEESCPKCKGKGKIKTPYYNHPQLLRFKVDDFDNKMLLISTYLHEIFIEADKRGYNFDRNKIYGDMLTSPQLTITKGQLDYEYAHLMQKLKIRDYNKFKKNVNLITKTWHDGITEIQPHPLFKVVEGDIENWEKIK